LEAEVLFDKDYALHQSGFVQISSSANGTGAPFDHLVLDVPIDKSGFIYIYTANETDDPAVNAYFDDLKITHKQMVVQADDYYPFGMAIEALSYERYGSMPQNFLYNDREFQKDINLNWYHLDTRMYDPALGRFHVIDLLADFMPGVSSYVYTFNNPVKFIDPWGLMSVIPSNTARERQSRIHETPGERRQRETGFNDFSHGFKNNSERTVTGEDGRHHTIGSNDIAVSGGLRPFGTRVFVEGKLIKNTIEGYYFVPLESIVSSIKSGIVNFLNPPLDITSSIVAAVGNFIFFTINEGFPDDPSSIIKTPENQLGLKPLKLDTNFNLVPGELYEGDPPIERSIELNKNTFSVILDVVSWPTLGIGKSVLMQKFLDFIIKTPTKSVLNKGVESGLDTQNPKKNE